MEVLRSLYHYKGSLRAWDSVFRLCKIWVLGSTRVRYGFRFFVRFGLWVEDYRFRVIYRPAPNTLSSKGLDPQNFLKLMGVCTSPNIHRYRCDWVNSSGSYVRLRGTNIRLLKPIRNLWNPQHLENANPVHNSNQIITCRSRSNPWRSPSKNMYRKEPL